MHTGEITLTGNNIAEIGVHIASRVMDLAPDGGIAVSSTVKDLTVGSPATYGKLGTFHLKGVPGDWDIYEVARTRPSPGDGADSHDAHALRWGEADGSGATRRRAGVSGTTRLRASRAQRNPVARIRAISPHRVGWVRSATPAGQRP